MPRLRSGKSGRRPGEFEVIELLARQLAARGPGVELGIGDDAALLEQVSGKLAVSVDTCLEHTHFERSWLSLEALGAKALHSAVSDLAAMGARPVAVLSALVLPKGFSSTQVRCLGRGQAAAAEALGCIVVGGNIARGRDLSLTTTVIGRAKRSLRRKGARVHDRVWLFGDLGLAGAGLRLIQAGKGRSRSAAAKLCLEAWRAPRALVQEGRRLAKRATAAIDISDGLAADAGHLARASARRLVIEERKLDKILRPELLEVASSLGVSGLELALSAGEDYALLATGPAKRKPRGARRIGRVEAGAGVFLERVDGTLQELSGGFDHFASPD